MRIEPADIQDVDFMRFLIEKKLNNRELYQIFNLVMSKRIYRPEIVDMYVGIDKENFDMRYFSAQDYEQKKFSLKILFTPELITLEEKDMENRMAENLEIQFLEDQKIKVFQRKNLCSDEMESFYRESFYENNKLVYQKIEDSIHPLQIYNKDRSFLIETYVDNFQKSAVYHRVLIDQNRNEQHLYLKYPSFTPICYNESTIPLEEISTLSYLISEEEYTQFKDQILSKNKSLLKMK